MPPFIQFHNLHYPTKREDCQEHDCDPDAAYDDAWLADALYSAAVGAVLGGTGAAVSPSTWISKKDGKASDAPEKAAADTETEEPFRPLAAPEVDEQAGQESAPETEAFLPLEAPGMETAEQQKTAPEGAENSRLTDADMQEYMRVGNREHVRNAKSAIVTRGESPILTKGAEIVDFIRKSFRGEVQDTIKAYGKVGRRFADRVRRATNGKLSIEGYYLELESNHLAHLDDHIDNDKDPRSIPLTLEQLEQLPDYIDTFDDLIDVIQRKDGSVRLQLGKKINGHTVIVETVSKGRRSLHPTTAYQVPTDWYNAFYKTKAVDRSSTSQSDKADQVDISRPTTTFEKRIAQAPPTVNPDAYLPLAAPDLETENTDAADHRPLAAPEVDEQAGQESAPETEAFLPLEAPGMETAEQQKTAPEGGAWHSEVPVVTNYNQADVQNIRKEARTFRNLIAGVDSKVSDFFGRWRAGRVSQNGEKLEKLYLSKMPEHVRRQVESILGYEIDARDFIVTNDDVKHVFDHHGNPKRELGKGNIPLEPWMMDVLPEVLVTPDSIEPGHLGTGKKNNGKLGVLFRKSFADGTVITVQYDNPSRGTMQLNSMYANKNKGTTSKLDTTKKAAPNSTPETLEPVPYIDSTIASPADSVKSSAAGAYLPLAAPDLETVAEPEGVLPLAAPGTEEEQATDGKAESQPQDAPDPRNDLPAKAKLNLQRAERTLAEKIGAVFSVPKTAQRDELAGVVRSLTGEYLQTGKISQETVDALFETAYDLGRKMGSEFYEKYKGVKDMLRTRAVSIGEDDRGDIPDYEEFRKGVFGTLRLTATGEPVEDVYRELTQMAPELFPEHVKRPADQLMRIKWRKRVCDFETCVVYYKS